MKHPSPTTDDHTTRPALGLTGKGRAAVVLIRVRESWDSLTPDQRAEVAELVARLSVAMRREIVAAPQQSRPLPLVGRIAS
jgi:hypothetical protein